MKLLLRLESIKMILAFTCNHDFTLYQMDVKIAFLNGYRKEEAYKKQPLGLKIQMLITMSINFKKFSLWP